MRINNLKNYLYVCPHCFNVVEYCTCFSLPHSLIQIDKNILPIIRVLNQKGYFTDICCEGHIGGCERMHIIFKKNYKFKTLPDNFIQSGELIYADITGKTEHGKKIKKAKLLKELLSWAELLESQNPIDKKR